MKFYFAGGAGSADEALAASMQQEVLDSVYFKRHPKRLFLLMPATEEEMAEQKKKEEPTPQQIEGFVRAFFAGTGFKKLSYLMEQKKVMLSVDFPDVFDKGKIEQCSRELAENYGWTAELKDSVNHAEMAKLLHGLFPSRIRKLSCYEAGRYYLITLCDREPQDEERRVSFLNRTGWQLRIAGEGRESAPFSEDTASGLAQRIGWRLHIADCFPVAAWEPRRMNTHITLRRWIAATSEAPAKMCRRKGVFPAFAATADHHHCGGKNQG